MKALLNGQFDVMIGVRGEKIVQVPLEVALSTEKKVDKEFFELTRILSL